MRLLIDGYNLIHASPHLLVAHQRGQGREALALALKLYRAAKPHRLTVVFDGGPQAGPTRASLHGVPVLYSGAEQSADQAILDLLGHDGCGCTVITDDRELAGLCRQKGAQVVSSREFAGRLMETAMGGGAGKGDGEEEQARTGTRKKGPSHRPAKARRKRQRSLERL